MTITTRLRSQKQLVPHSAMLIALTLSATACGTMSSRVVTDPTEAVARLRAGGSIQTEADRLAQPLIDTGEFYGVAVGVIAPGAGAECFGYGSTGIKGRAQPPRGDTLFQIGSVSKLFIAALLATLVDEGALRYEDTVRSILPPNIPVSAKAGDVTLYQLAVNTGGFPREPVSIFQLSDFMAYLFTGRNVYAFITKPYMYQYLRTGAILPGSYQYSNIGYGLLAHLIEVKMGRPFPDLLEEKICRPLNLRDTRFVLDAEQRTRLAIGHVGVQPRFMLYGAPMKPWAMGEIMGPPSCLYSTVNDLLIFARANLGLLDHPLARALVSMQRAQLRRPTEDVALGWLINYVGDDRVKITYKHGMVAGYHCYIGMNTDAKIAVVAVYNTFGWDDKIGHNLVLRLSKGLVPSYSPSNP